MASGGKRRGVGERVLESKHVIGLFMLMLLFSGVFFTLGYVMGRNQIDGQVRASTNSHGLGDDVIPKKETAKKPVAETPATDSASDPATQPGQGGWEFYDSKNSKPEDHLKTAPSAPSKTVPVHTTTTIVPRGNGTATKSMNGPLIPHGSYMLQVAALTKQADALDVATRLQKKKFPAFVISAQSDKYYRVQVGPYADQKSAEAARKGLEIAGFKAIVKH